MTQEHIRSRMEKLQEKIGQKRMFYRLLLYFCIFAAILTIGLAATLGMVSEDALENEIRNNAKANVQQAANIVQFRAEFVNLLLQNIQMDKDFGKLLTAKENDVEESAKIIRELGRMRMTIPNLYSIYIYNQQEGVIYESSAYSQTSINQVEYFADTGFTDILEHIENYTKFTPILRKVPLLYAGNQQKLVNVYTYLYFDRFNTGKTGNIVAMNFSTDWIRDALGYVQNQEEILTDIRIVNEEGIVLYSPQEREIGEEYDRQDILKQIPDGVSEGNFDIEDEKIVTYARSTDQGYDDWIFINVSETALLLSDVRRVRFLIYQISFVLLLLGSAGALLLSKRLYMPIQSMRLKVQLLEEEQKKQQMERRIYLKNMLYGNEDVRADMESGLLDKWKFEFPLNSPIQLMLVSIDYYSSFQRRKGKETKQIEVRLQERLTECASVYFENVLCIEVKEGTYALIAAVNLGMDEQLSESVIKMKEEAEQCVETTVSIACSSYGESLENASDLMAEALNIQSCRYILGYGKILTVRDVERIGKKAFDYPKEQEKQIIACLFRGETEETEKAYREFVAELDGCSPDEIRLNYMQLAYVIKRHAQNTSVEASGFLLDFDAFCMKIYSLQTMEEVDRLFLHMFDEIGEKVKATSKQKYDRLLNQVRDFVECHYMESGYSINDVAAEVEMTGAYLGRLFKQLSGQTFTEYLTGYRLERACSLLTDTDKTVQEISEMVGFTNSSYFYIVFKKYFTCTPNQYRSGWKKDDRDESGMGDKNEKKDVVK